MLRQRPLGGRQRKAPAGRRDTSPFVPVGVEGPQLQAREPSAAAVAGVSAPPPGGQRLGSPISTVTEGLRLGITFFVKAVLSLSSPAVKFNSTRIDLAAKNIREL